MFGLFPSSQRVVFVQRVPMADVSRGLLEVHLPHQRVQPFPPEKGQHYRPLVRQTLHLLRCHSSTSVCLQLTRNVQRFSSDIIFFRVLLLKKHNPDVYRLITLLMDHNDILEESIRKRRQTLVDFLRKACRLGDDFSDNVSRYINIPHKKVTFIKCVVVKWCITRIISYYVA